jgi:hypothetical protein
MVSQLVTRAGKVLIPGLAALALGLGIVGGGAAEARDNDLGHSGALCIYEGKEYSEGSIILMNGAKYICRDGKWEFFSSAVISPVKVRGVSSASLGTLQLAP